MSCVPTCYIAFYLYVVIDVVNGGPDIAIDYYFGDALRKVEPQDSCDNIYYRQLCKIKCNGQHACAMSKCFCATTLEGDKHETIKEVRKMERMKYNPHTALRHHIAHFCPNLDEARQCIRTCMKIGKPAFCGKDHVCYCGHKTKSLKDLTKADIISTYVNFRDMYNKYFGSANKSNTTEMYINEIYFKTHQANTI